MAAYHSATFGALPLDGFLVKELLHTMFLHKLEVLYHTHVIFRTIAFIEVFQSSTGEILAFIAET